jgi:glycosyltransferase involved in cell wall biosynthesis
MRIVIDGLPITGSSLAIVVEHLLAGWQQLPEADELHLVLGPGAELTVPEAVTVHRVPFGRVGAVSRIRAQNVTLPKLCRRLRADAMLGVLPTTTVAPLPCPRAIIAYDIRHELRPQQFSRKSRAMRMVSYGLGFRQAAGIACISDRTREDLLRSRPWLAGRPVRTTLLGADHVDAWPRLGDAPFYALAFGQYGNKNVDLVLDGWRRLQEQDAALPLVLLGLGGADRAHVEARIDALGLAGTVTALPWLSIEEFRERFVSAGLVVFPSDFEGFGLPAVESMRRRIPLVITPEPALLEVTGGLATVMDGWDADALADAVRIARGTPPEALDRAEEHAAPFTWARTAAGVRALLGEIATS